MLFPQFYLNFLNFQTKFEQGRKEVSDLNVQLSTSLSEVSSLSKDLETVKSAKEKLSLELAEISGNALTQSQSQAERNDNLTKMVSALESEVARRKGQAAEAEGKLAAVEKEFHSYKVRAQNVLRQKETSGGGDSNQSQKSQEVKIALVSLTFVGMTVTKHAITSRSPR